MIDRLLRSWMSDPARVALLSPALSLPLGAHPDPESIAGALEGDVDARTLAHLVRCPECLQLLTLLDGADPDETTTPASAHPLLIASIALPEGVPPQILAASGTRRIAPSLVTRDGLSAPALMLRDDREHPSFELSLVVAPRDARLDLHVRWLGDGAEPTDLRLSRNGRTLALTPLLQRQASIPSLRPGPFRLTFLRHDAAVAEAWLECSR